MFDRCSIAFQSRRFEAGWKRNGGGLEDLWRIGGGLVEDWKMIGEGSVDRLSFEVQKMFAGSRSILGWMFDSCSLDFRSMFDRFAKVFRSMRFCCSC